MTTLKYIHIYFIAKNNYRERYYCNFWLDIFGRDSQKYKNQIIFIK